LERLESITRALNELAELMGEQPSTGGLGAVDVQLVGHRLVSVAGDLTTLGVDMARAGDGSDETSDGAGSAI
jgi:hypothetical protein